MLVVRCAACELHKSLPMTSVRNFSEEWCSKDHSSEYSENSGQQVSKGCNVSQGQPLTRMP